MNTISRLLRNGQVIAIAAMTCAVTPLAADKMLATRAKSINENELPLAAPFTDPVAPHMLVGSGNISPVPLLNNRHATPFELEFNRHGGHYDIITAYKSTNGTSWITVGSTTVTMATNCYIGLAVSSGSNTTLNTSQFSNVSVTP